MAENEGYRLTFVSFRLYEEIYNKLAAGRNDGIMPGNNIEQVAEQIERKWVHGETAWDNDGNIKNYYFDSKGGFAVIGRRNNEAKDIFNVCFVSGYMEDLEKTVRGFGLFFDSSKVYCNVAGM
jgi:hypothetical protein